MLVNRKGVLVNGCILVLIVFVADIFKDKAMIEDLESLVISLTEKIPPLASGLAREHSSGWDRCVN
jgi:hypothetical protein